MMSATLSNELPTLNRINSFITIVIMKDVFERHA